MARFYPLIFWATGVTFFTSSLLCPFSPIPFALIGIFHGRKKLILFSILSIILANILFNTSQAVLILSYSLGMAWIWNETLKLKIPLINFLIISVGGCFTILSLSLFIISKGDIPTYINNALLTEIKQFLEASIYQYPQVYQEQLREFIIAKQPQEIARQITDLLPGILGSLVVLLSWFVVAFTKVKNALINLELPSSLTLWSTPSNFVWAVVVSIPATIWGSGSLKVFGMTVLCILGAFYFLHGFSIVRYWFIIRNVSKWIRAVSYFLIFLFYPFTAAILGVGLFDPLLNFREKMDNTNDEEEGELI